MNVVGDVGHHITRTYRVDPDAVVNRLKGEGSGHSFLLR
jgi:hypothetical protein